MCGKVLHIWRIVVLVLVAIGAQLFVNGFSNAAGQHLQPEWRVAEPVVYESLSIFPVLARGSADTSGFVTLDEALTSGEAVVTERGGDTLRRSRGGTPSWQGSESGARVNQLVLVHRGAKPLVLLAGEVVSGGKQDRVISKDRIVPPGAEPLPLDVFCVERGRWAGAGAQFSTAKMMVHPSVREKAVVDQDQNQVWAAVRGDTQRAGGNPIVGVGGYVGGIPGGVVGGVIGTEARSESYVSIYKSARISEPVDNFVEEVARRFARATATLKQEQVVGIVVAFGGEVAWADVFASPALFDRYWTKLLRSYVVEALGRSERHEQASPEDAREFLRALSGRETVESEPGVYRWRQISQGRLIEISLESAGPKPMTLHWCKVLRNNR